MILSIGELKSYGTRHVYVIWHFKIGFQQISTYMTIRPAFGMGSSVSLPLVSASDLFAVR